MLDDKLTEFLFSLPVRDTLLIFHNRPNDFPSTMMNFAMKFTTLDA